MGENPDHLVGLPAHVHTKRHLIGSSGRRLWLRKFFRRPAAVVGVAIVAVILFLAIFAPWLAPADPYRQRIEDRLSPPSWSRDGSSGHWLGTEHLGRDVASRIIYGARVSLGVSFVSVYLAALFGVSVGLAAAYGSEALGEFLMRVTDIQIAFPYIVLAITVIAVLGTSFVNLIIVLAIWAWPSFARIAYAQGQSEASKEYVLAAQAIGCSSLRIMFKHVLPNISPPIIVIWTFTIGSMIIAESSLSFLGVGVPPPTPSWGSMISDGRVFIDTAWWVITFPGLAILVTVLGVTLLGDGLRDVLDPRVRR